MGQAITSNTPIWRELTRLEPALARLERMARRSFDWTGWHRLIDRLRTLVGPGARGFRYHVATGGGVSRVSGQGSNRWRCNWASAALLTSA